jgi:hypothetical protein
MHVQFGTLIISKEPVSEKKSLHELTVLFKREIIFNHASPTIFINLRVRWTPPLSFTKTSMIHWRSFRQIFWKCHSAV